MTTQLAAFTAGASATYMLGLGMGVSPPLFGKEEVREWNRRKWGKRACAVMDELDADWRYMLMRPKSSNRNFVHVQSDAKRISFVCYTSFWDRRLRGVAKFGMSSAQQPNNKCICGGAVSAAADQILGMFAVTMLMLPVVTANLDVQLKQNIPLGSELGMLCTIEEGSDRIKKLIVRLSFYFLEEDVDESKREAAVVTGIFVNSILPMLPDSLRSYL